MATHAQKLEDELARRPERVLIIAGIGVSLASCPSCNALSWKGLLKNGLMRCEELGVDKLRITNQRTILDTASSTADDYINVGSFITSELTKNRPGQYGRWLNEVFGEIKPAETRLLKALRSVGVKLATTNYDHLIELGCGGTTITWLETARSLEFLRNQSDDVLHLHGSCRQPDSVVLGLSTYDKICKEPSIQSALRSCFILGTIIFVGCGDGLADPNFGTLLDWARETLKLCQHDHYILVRDNEIMNWQNQLRGLPIVPVAYGENYADLAPFIEKLVQGVESTRRLHDPTAKLIAAQSTYDMSHSALEAAQSQLTPADFLRQELAIARNLVEAGGNQQAAFSFSNAVTFQATKISNQELIEFSLRAAEFLLIVDQARMAADHIDTASRLISIETSYEVRTQLNRLQIQCYAELSAYRQLLEVIERELTHASDESREQLEAERDEARWLQGEYTDDTNVRAQQ